MLFKAWLALLQLAINIPSGVYTMLWKFIYNLHIKISMAIKVMLAILACLIMIACDLIPEKVVIVDKNTKLKNYFVRGNLPI